MVKTLLKSLREYKRGSIVTVFLMVIEVVFEILIPLCMSNLIDFGINQNDMGQVWKFGSALFVLALFQLAAGMSAAHIGARASVGFAANLRQDMYDNVQDRKSVV